MATFIITKWHKKNPNDWCALDPKTHKLIDRAPLLSQLAERIRAKKIDVVYCRNWFRPAPNL